MTKQSLLTIIVFILSIINSYPYLEIHCINVGQGDATFVRSTNGKSMLIDAGNNDSRCYDYLHSIGITEIDYFVATHYHADHIGGIDIVINNGINIIEASYDRGGSYYTGEYNEYANIISEIRQTIKPGDEIDLLDGVKALCIAVNGDIYRGPSIDTTAGNRDDENGRSVALIISYGEFKFFIAGDLSGIYDDRYVDVETPLATANGDILDCNVYQVNHHGSYSSSNSKFLSKLLPEVSIISCGNNNSHGHPDCKTITRLRNVQTVIYQTEKGTGCLGDYYSCGNIVIRSYPEEYYTVSFDDIIHYYDVHLSTDVKITSIPKPIVSPNPYYFSTSELGIKFENLLVESTVKIYTISGEFIIELLPPNFQGVTYWNGRNQNNQKVASGIYLYIISYKNLRRYGKFAILK